MMKVNLHDFGVDFLCLSFWDDDDIDHLVGFYFCPCLCNTEIRVPRCWPNQPQHGGHV
jgi:hypothetical protein